MVLGRDVKLPDVFRLPWGQRFGIDRFDVSVGEEAEHLQALRSPDLFGERSNRHGIENVAPQGRRKFEVIGNQEENFLALLGINIEAIHRVVCDLEAGFHVIAAGHSFACVVEE